jgi:CheY-like chemotaxis protein
LTELSDDRPVVRADRGQLSQVLVNLVLNARDSMPQGGTILIETSGLSLETRQTAVGNQDGFVALTVADTGTGMDEATKDRIFEPFFTTKGKHEGTGLGLATVYGIVERAGGFLEVDSTPGVGSTFRVSLPVAVTPRPVLVAGVAARSTAPLNQRVLVVEDERVVRELVIEQLESLGHIVTGAPTPALAVKLFEERGAEFDLVVTDVVMPGMNGWDLTKRLREDRADLPIVLMSGYTDGALATADLVGPTAFLAKPFTLDALAKKMQEVTLQEQLVAP